MAKSPKGAPTKATPAAKPTVLPTRLTTAELAKFFRVSRESIQAWNKKGIPRERERGEDGKLRSFYRLAEVKKWLEDQGNERANEVPEGVSSEGGTAAGIAGTPAPAPLSPTGADDDTLGALKIKLALAELRRRRADAEKRELALAVTRGLYLLRTAVDSDMAAKITAAKAGLLAIPSRCAARCAGRTAVEVEEFVREEVEGVMRGFAGESAVVVPPSTQSVDVKDAKEAAKVGGSGS